VNEDFSLDKTSPRHEVHQSKLAYRINVILIANYRTNKKKLFVQSVHFKDYKYIFWDT
jgi:hypothetical protein